MTASNVAGKVRVPPSKSHTHRVLIMGLMGDGESRISSPLLAGDTLSTLSACEAMGAEVMFTEDGLFMTSNGPRCPRSRIDVGNSGTTLRFMTGIASLLPCTTVLDGDSSIRRRPMAPLLEALEHLGAVISSNQGMPPVSVRGPTEAGEVEIRGDMSSQFVSSLLMSSVGRDGRTTIKWTTPLVSRPYLRMTGSMMERFGAYVEWYEDAVSVEGPVRLRIGEYTVPGDMSSAAFPLVAGAIAGDVTVEGIDSQADHPDTAILQILRDFGADVHEGEGHVRVAGGNLVATEVDLSASPDLFPVVCVLAACSEGCSKIQGAPHLRHKESDRISTTTMMLRSMGVKIHELPDGAEVTGGEMRGTTVAHHGDHRIAMAGAIASLVAEGETTIPGFEVADVSYPGFLSDIRDLKKEGSGK